VARNHRAYRRLWQRETVAGPDLLAGQEAVGCLRHCFLPFGPLSFLASVCARFRLPCLHPRTSQVEYPRCALVSFVWASCSHRLHACPSSSHTQMFENEKTLFAKQIPRKVPVAWVGLARWASFLV